MNVGTIEPVDPSIVVSGPEDDGSGKLYWYSEHAAILLTTGKWALLGTVAGLCVGFATRIFLTLIGLTESITSHLNVGVFRSYDLLPISLPCCVWLIRTYAPTAKGHGTEAVITAVHTTSGKVKLSVAPIKLLATLLTLAFGGSVGKEGPCAQIGASITSGFADLLRLSDHDRRRLVICGIGAGFAAVFGTPISGALFGIEVLSLGKIEYSVLLPCVVAGIVANLVCGSSPHLPAISSNLGMHNPSLLVALALGFGVVFGAAARLMIGVMNSVERITHRFNKHPYLVAVVGGAVLAVLYRIFGGEYSGLGLITIDRSLHGAINISIMAFAIKIVTTSITLESGGSGGIITPLFFVGSTLGAAVGSYFGLPPALIAAFGFVAVVAAGANTPIAASVMGIELLGSPVGIYAALCACTAYLIVGHASVYKSQRLGFSKSAGLDVPLNISIGELRQGDIKVKPGTLAARFNRYSTKKISRPRTWKLPKGKGPS